MIKSDHHDYSRFVLLAIGKLFPDGLGRGALDGLYGGLLLLGLSLLLRLLLSRELSGLWSFSHVST